MRQRTLLGRVSVAASAYGRFFYGLPLSLILLAVVALMVGRLPPAPTPVFLLYAAGGGLAQVLGNALFIKLIRAGNFTVMTTYSKMETVISPVLSFALLGDRLSIAGMSGVFIAVLGVMVLSAARATGSLGAVLAAFAQRAAVSGVGVGALYAVASTSYRAASLSLGGDGFALQAATALAWVTTLQVILSGGYLCLRAPQVMREVVREARALVWIGVTGIAASACWYAAFALQKTGYVLAVGQVELVFAYLASHLVFKERATRVEIVGILITVAGIMTVVASR